MTVKIQNHPEMCFNERWQNHLFSMKHPTSLPVTAFSKNLLLYRLFWAHRHSWLTWSSFHTWVATEWAQLAEGGIEELPCLRISYRATTRSQSREGFSTVAESSRVVSSALRYSILNGWPNFRAFLLDADWLPVFGKPECVRQCIKIWNVLGKVIKNQTFKEKELNLLTHFRHCEIFLELFWRNSGTACSIITPAGNYYEFR